LDPLAGFFLLIVGILGAVSTVYGRAYLADEQSRPKIRWAWPAYALLLLSLVLVVTAADAVLFLVAWEMMAIASWALVVLDDGAANRRAGWIYFAACHLGAACLLAMFLLLGTAAGSTSFAAIAAASIAADWLPWVWGLALLGFGSKAGLMPLHVWLPEAHAAVPSHVSALMSGVMTKMGLYGLLRLANLIGMPPAGIAETLIVLGAVSGILGALQAGAQDDVKRLLAYSTIENVGMIAMGLGLGWLGAAMGRPLLAAAGYAAALIHVLHHAFAKGATFLAAGAVVHATGTRSLARLGGLIRTMPRTGLAFALGAGILSGLPAGAGLLSEFLLLTASYQSVDIAWRQDRISPLLIIAAVALTATLAMAAFLKAFGIAFLGHARSVLDRLPHDPPATMIAPIAILLTGSMLLATALPVVLPRLTPILALLPGTEPARTMTYLQGILAVIRTLQTVCALLLIAVLIIVTVRRLLLRRRPVASGPTWDCGYGRPTARMQYTASSFSRPLTVLFGPLAGLKLKHRAPQGLFPDGAALTVSDHDPWRDHVYTPLFRGIATGLGQLRWLQHGNTHVYILYVALTLVTVTVWALWS
jgi:formate hydrogenlyase subunit 3/multisubunit Na+/H+ antiporter MnhD subunit